MHIDYDTFASMSPLKKNSVMHKLTIENVAELVRTHFQRFLDANRARLSAEQIATIEEDIASIAPDLYREDRERTEEEFNRMRRKEEERLRLFSPDDARALHMGAFKNCGDVRNPLARALMRIGSGHRSDDHEAAFHDLATLPVSELRQKRPGLPAMLRKIIEIPDDFWSHVDDEDVRLAASRARALTHTMRNPLALILSKDVPRPGDGLAQVLREMRELPAQQLRRDLPEVLSRHYDGIPTGEEFWRLADDGDVRMAANNAYVLVKQPWLRRRV